MALKKKPTTGMRDILPNEMEIREYVLSVIRDTYSSFGFSQIDTPAVEPIENLTGGHGGENEKLIFKILKRGQKLNLETARDESDLVDGGLRFDLTIPLVRYYSNNQAELPSPFKAMQLGNVWRADRPQRGRFRQFMQCDIDVLGEASNLAEIELILAMSTVLGRLDFKKYTIRINDRRILKGIAKYCSFPEDKYDDVFIVLDKMDKIGLDGVREELIESGYDAGSVEKCMEIFASDEINGDRADSVSALEKLAKKLGESLEEGVLDNLTEIISVTTGTGNAELNVRFDPTLVRGMSYYTGPIFEISMDEYGGSVGGGGRYDTMVGRFLGQDTPACGFSIGFERIAMLLMEREYKIPSKSEKVAFLLEKKCSPEQVRETIEKANALRKEGKRVSVMRMKKNKKFQKEQLEAEGYTAIEEVFGK
ncbi:MAG TPA: histidine--tRNA ligase [Lachnospiraceae bacterium]|nr:histidine--tRNA ligase [Lachnospiraceae bacterium]